MEKSVMPHQCISVIHKADIVEKKNKKRNKKKLIN